MKENYHQVDRERKRRDMVYVEYYIILFLRYCISWYKYILTATTDNDRDFFFKGSGERKREREGHF